MQKNQSADTTTSRKRLERLYEAILVLKNRQEAAAFLRDLCTMTELQAMAERLAVAERVAKDESYRDIADDVQTSTTTVTRVAHWFKHGRGGYPLIISRMHKKAT